MLANRIFAEEPCGYDIVFTPEEQTSLRSLAWSKKLRDRKLCAKWLKQAAMGTEPANKSLVLELADHLIPDPNHDIRWGILTIALSPNLRHWAPEELWPLVVKWGSVTNRDIRAGVGVCVLEHILEHHFEEYFKQAQQLIAEGNRLFGYTLSCCGKFGQTAEPANAEAFDAFIASLPARARKAAD